MIRRAALAAAGIGAALTAVFAAAAEEAAPAETPLPTATVPDDSRPPPDGAAAATDYNTALDDAVTAARSGDRAKARELLTVLAAAYPGRPELFYNLALTWEFDDDGNRYKGEGLYAAAAAYQQSLGLDPGFAPARLNLGVVWQKLGFFEEAANQYRLAVGAGGEIGARATFNLALVLKGQGRWEEAATVLEKDAATFGNAARVRLLAFLAEDTRDYARALALWKRALALEDKPPYGAMARKHLETLRAY